MLKMKLNGLMLPVQFLDKEAFNTNDITEDVPYTLVDDKMYRPRVELLLIRNGKVFCMKQNHLNQYGTNYKLPGGGIDKEDITLYDRVIAECQEEARITPTNLEYVGYYIVSYGGVYPSWQIKKLWPYGIKYEGAIVYLFTGIEEKKYTGYVKAHDREPEFVAKARYHDISKLKYRKEHLYAVNKYMENK